MNPLRSAILASLKADLNWALQVIASYKKTPSMPTQPIPDFLTKMCLAIRDYEGAPGDLNYQNNNPGNCRCSAVGYAPYYGTVLCVDTTSGKFAKFATYDLGWHYLLNLVKERAIANPTWSLVQFFESYAPAADKNNPTHYAIFVAKRMGVTTDWQLSNLL